MKIILVSLLLAFSFSAFCQSAEKYYFDQEIHPVAKKKAVFYGTGEMDSGLYKLSCYYLKRKNPIGCVAHFKDSTLKVHEGSYQFYFENGITGTIGKYHKGDKEGLWIDYDHKGIITDSIEYRNGRALNRTGFYDLSATQEKMITVDDVVNNEFYIALYNVHGDLISKEEVPQDYTDIDFNNDTSSSFPGGAAEWTRYMSKAIISHIDDFSNADYGTVLLRFVVDSDGSITDVRPLNMKTSRLAIIAFNAIDSGPKWIPAEHDGKKVKSVKIQPVTLNNTN